MSDYERSTLQRALLPDYDAPLPLAEALQAEAEPHTPAPLPWNAERAHARIRFLAGALGLSCVALILALLITGAPAHG
ncbi:MAG: hypothetical protein B7X90_01915 [Novosphingobium sp. 17-62-19]|uniref:hypothetical protein n=1 Tax=Novosphingobium sp. 17-62-19 TaxID=1970406 RepID=UPI000BCDFD28|nr:hypothetical protein [Novosphingobium sp. 17-62-19]OZA21394.1 MAG: hypothetical protein B7X90_01915 [Novosphingobium sp. 17-62-19]HQS95061.1 hypothetical protein [Novosphingobium sp.]